MGDLKERIKVEAGNKNVHEKSIDDTIYNYLNKKYKNIINEINLIKKILESCDENDKEIKQQYTEVLEQLEKEKWEFFNKIREMDKDIYAEER